MAKFIYLAITLKGVRQRALVEAASAEEAKLMLRDSGLFVTRLNEAPERRASFIMNSRQVGEFFKELSLMLKSGLSIAKALGVSVSGQAAGSKTRKLYEELHKMIRGGMALSEAMRQSRAFPDMAVNMVYGGEVGGQMAAAAEKLSENYVADYKLRKRISAATAYPKILAALTAGALVIVFSFVLPNILSMIGDQELPPLTQFMKSISDYMSTKWYNVLLGAFLIVIAFMALKRIKAVRYAYHKAVLKLPAVGPLLKTIYTARFARSISSLYGSGINLVTAIAVSARVIGNSYLERQFDSILQKVRRGETMSDAVASADGFSPKLHSLLVIGEETGKLADILNFAAVSFEFDSDSAIGSLLALLEPSLLILMALIIGTVVISVLLPVFQMYNMVGGI